MKRYLEILTATIFAFTFFVFSPLLSLMGSVRAGEAKPAWQVEWDKTVKEAKKEGKLNIYFWQGGKLEDALHAFVKKYPEIKLTTTAGRGSRFIARIAAEMRAGKYLADLCLCGSSSPYKVLYKRARVLAPLKSVFVLPEVKDESKWWQGKHHFQDPEGQYLFAFRGNPGTARISYNSNLVNPKEFKSVWDLLDPKWKGKMVAVDARESAGGWRQLYYNPEIGPAFIRRLMKEMDVTLSRNERQTTDWLAVGKFAIAFFSRGVDDAKNQGLPVDTFLSANFKEPAAISTGANGTLGLMKSAPHPNAAKMFVNWFLSREGQTTYQKIMNTRDDHIESLREDIPKDLIPPDYLRKEGGKYIIMNTPERMNSTPVLNLFKEILKR